VPLPFPLRSAPLCQTCKKVKDNEENCARARKRASVLLPLLSQIYNRVSQDPRQMCPAIDDAVKGIAEQLNIQVGVWQGKGAGSSLFSTRWSACRRLCAPCETLPARGFGRLRRRMNL
jgi:hypothetical protein